MAYTYTGLALDPAGTPIGGRLYEVWTAKNGSRIYAVNDLQTPATAGYVTSASSPRGRVNFTIDAEDWPTVWLKAPTGDWWGPVVADEITNQIPEAVAESAAALQLATDTAERFEHLASATESALGQIGISVAQYATEEQLTGLADAGPAVQAAIDALPPGGRLTAPAGATLWFTGATVAKLKSNIEIDLRGATITKTSGAGYYCIFVGVSAGQTGYGSGPSNVIIRNGYFRGDLNNGGTLCVLAGHHMSNVVVENCEMVGCQGSGHTYDISACDTVIFRNCRWYGCIPYSNPGRPETIELDQSLNGALSYTDTAGSHDGLLTRNVTVEDCQFWPLKDGATVWPAPVPLGAHGQREGQWYENITVRNMLVVDPPKDLSGGTSTGIDDIYIRGLIHFPTVRGLHIDGMKVVATDGLGSIRAVMVTGRTSGTLAAGNPNTETTEGTWAVPQGGRDIYINDLNVIGMKNTGSSTNPIVNICGVTGADIENVHINCSIDGAYREAVLLYRCRDVQINFNRCKDADSGARLVRCTNVQVQGQLTEVNLPVRLDTTNVANIGPITDTKATTTNALVIITNGSTDVTCTGIVARNRTWLYGASGTEVKPSRHAETAIIGPAVSP